MDIQPNEHSMIEQSIRSRIMNLGENENLMNRLDLFYLEDFKILNHEKTLQVLFHWMYLTR